MPAFRYELDFVDPHTDGAWNRFSSQVSDVTAGRTLGGEFRSGSSPSLSCSRRSIAMQSPVDLAGHTIQVVFSGSKAYTDTQIHVKAVSLTK